MRKSYLFLLSLLTILTCTFSSSAVTITAKVNQVNKVTIDGNLLTQEEQQVTFNGQVELALVDESSTVYVKNITTSEVIGAGDSYRCYLHPGNSHDNDVLEIKVSGGDAPQVIQIVFNPENCGYVTMGEEDNLQTFQPEDNLIEIPYDADSEFLIHPNAGYSFVNCKNESEMSNPHYTGISPELDGNFHCSMSRLNSGAVLVVTAVKDGSFTVKAIGETNIGNLYFKSNKDDEPITVTTEPQTISFSGQVEYTIGYNLWKVLRTNAAEDVTDEDISGGAGYAHYIPQDGDELVIYTDKPVYTYTVKISVAEQAKKSMITSLNYASSPLDLDKLDYDTFTVTGSPGDELVIGLDYTGFQNVTYTVNESDAKTPVYTTFGGTTGYFIKVPISEATNIVISADKEVPYTVTLKSNIPAGVKVSQIQGTGYTAISTFPFSASGQTISVAPSANKIKFEANPGYKIVSFLVDNAEPTEGDFADGYHYVKADEEITIEVQSMAELRTKTAVVYLEPVTWGYTEFKYADQSKVTLKTGYNYIKYCDEDRPFDVSALVNVMASNNTTTYYIDDEEYDKTQLPYKLQEYEEGCIIRIYSAEQIPATVTYNIADEFADIVEIAHDQNKPVKASEWNGTVLPGTEIWITIKDEAPAAARRNTRSEDIELYADEAKPYVVKINDEVLSPNAQGVYIATVGGNSSIEVVKNTGTGVIGIDADNAAASTVFNLQGIAVKKAATDNDIKSLPAGIYLINGKKVIVK